MAGPSNSAQEKYVTLVGVPAEVLDPLESVLTAHGLCAAPVGHTGSDEKRPAGLVLAVPAPATGWTDIVEDSVTAAWLTLRDHIPGLLDSRPGSIVICCPPYVHAVGDTESKVATAVAQEAMVGLVHCLANELGPNRIRVNAVTRHAGQWSPGTLATIGWLLSDQARQITGVYIPEFAIKRPFTVAHDGPLQP